MLSGKAINVLMVALVGVMLYSMVEVDATETDREMQSRLLRHFDCMENMYCRIAVDFYVQSPNESNRYYQDLITRFGFQPKDLVRR
ncbi:hypothetical protein DdX_14702 [Ditylenchus destructor]|uniref:Uncharacterized protein n=1 Tax=Ditylenchus destructor TaxID=166010 RepID=A0AAD4MU02_9BILA|nr:hypothetical protein DdX_14702 [Ditylenchus destructor]